MQTFFSRNLDKQQSGVRTCYPSIDVYHLCSAEIDRVVWLANSAACLSDRQSNKKTCKIVSTNTFCAFCDGKLVFLLFLRISNHCRTNMHG